MGVKANPIECRSPALLLPVHETLIWGKKWMWPHGKKEIIFWFRLACAINYTSDVWLGLCWGKNFQIGLILSQIPDQTGRPDFHHEVSHVTQPTELSVCVTAANQCWDSPDIRTLNQTIRKQLLLCVNTTELLQHDFIHHRVMMWAHTWRYVLRFWSFHNWYSADMMITWTVVSDRERLLLMLIANADSCVSG